MANRVKTELDFDAVKALANIKKVTEALSETTATLNKTASSFSNIKKAIDNNTNVMNKAANLYKIANKEFKDTGKELKNVNEKTKETAKSQKDLGKQSQTTASGMAAAFGKVGVAVSATIGTFKSIASAIGNVAKKIQELVTPQAEYIEDLNFLDNAYGKANNSGKQLLDTLNQMVGYDPTTLIKSTAIFRQMGNALDMDSEIADRLANNLVKLSVDVKSITGQDLQKVAGKFQSAMAGNIRAVRAYGVDVTQAGLQNELLRLGIDKEIGSLNRAEKSILTYIAMSRQLQTANGDLSKTVNSVGNQWEIFKNQIAQLGRLIGGFFIPILKAILPVLNGIIMALNTIISMVMSFFGIDAESFSQEFGSVSSGVDDLSDAFDDMADSASGAGKAAKEAQKSLRGFDKLNNITTPTASKGSGGGASGGIGSINSDLLDAFNKLGDYNLHLEEMNNWATKIRDKIMEWLGFTKIVDAETGKVTYKFKGFTTLLDNVRNTLKKIQSNPIFSYLKAIGWQTMFGPLGLVLDGLTRVLLKNDEVWGKFKTTISDTFKAITPLFEFFSNKVIPDIGNAFKWLEDNIITPFNDFIDGVFTDLWNNVIFPAWERINNEILPPLIELLQKLWNDVLVPIATWIGDTLAPKIQTVITVLEWLWKNILEPIINFIVNDVINHIKIAIEVVNGVIDAIKMFNQIIEFVKYVLERLYNKFMKPIVDFIKDKVITIIDKVKEKIDMIKERIGEKLSPVIEKAKEKLDKFKEAFEKLREKIADKVQPVVDKFKEVIDGLKAAFESFKNFMNDIFVGDFDKAFDKLKKKFDETIGKMLQPVNDLKNALSKIGGGLLDSGISTLKGLFGKAEGGIWNNGVWSPVKTYAGGGFPSRGEIFMARETKGPELVGRIGSSTAVLNNDQILEQMTIAVARGIAASGKQDKTVPIVASADTEGLLNFIQFKSASKNRQYGL